MKAKGDTERQIKQIHHSERRSGFGVGKDRMHTPQLGKTNRVSEAPFFRQYSGTFRLNKKQAIHNWYHLVEGFSGELVLSILQQYADASTKVYDPFAGCGTTPLTASYIFLDSYISEVNPFLRFVSDVKVNVVRRVAMNFRSQRKIFEDLVDSLALLDDDRFSKNINVSDTISDCFSHRRYFDDVVLSKIAYLKCLIESIREDSLDVAKILLLALASILVSVSHTKRATDLRYKTKKEESKTNYRVFEVFRDKLVSVYNDIQYIDSASLLGKMRFLSEDVRKPVYGSEEIADISITSPPYLNGTNYFRNTKLELWILDFIQHEHELRKFREVSIPAGINDISKSRGDFTSIDFVEPIAKKLDGVAYDSRIPKMVRYYFSDMYQSLSQIFRVLRSGGYLFLDIGDSKFCGVHVATDQLLKQIAQGMVGLEFKEEHLIRTRRSYDKSLLKENLLVFRRPVARISRAEEEVPYTLTTKIQRFGSILPYQVYPYSKRNWGHPLHSLCSYQSKLKPAIAHFLIDYFTEEKQTILDPFGGVGTIPFEACLQGRRGISNDISEVAYYNAMAKVGKIDQKEVASELRRLEKYIERHLVGEQQAQTVELRINRDIKEYYHQLTLREILTARKYYQENPPKNSSHALVSACLLHILHGNRPYALSRRSHGITPFAPTGPFVYKSLVEKLNEKVARMLNPNYPKGFIEGLSFNRSVFDIQEELGNLEIDAIITSPPFFKSTRFHTSNWIRSWFCGWEQEDFNLKKNEFLEIIQSKGLTIYKKIFEIFYKLLPPKGLCVMHLGSTRLCDMGLELKDYATDYFIPIDLIYEHVGEGEKHGIRDQGITKRHQFLFLERK